MIRIRNPFYRRPVELIVSGIPTTEPPPVIPEAYRDEIWETLNRHLYEYSPEHIYYPGVNDDSIEAAIDALLAGGYIHIPVESDPERLHRVAQQLHQQQRRRGESATSWEELSEMSKELLLFDARQLLIVARLPLPEEETKE